MSFKTAFIFFAILTHKCLAQTTIEFDQWTTAQGLSQVSVFAMIQDRDGYMWFATENGLNKFDGYDFTVYTHTDSNSISDPLVYTMAEDEEGLLWVATYGGGLNRFDRRTQKFTSYKNDPNNPASIPSNFVTVFYISPRNPEIIWAGTDGGGLTRFDKKTGQFTRYQFDPNNENSLGNNRIYSMNGDDDENLWIGTRGGLTRFDPVRNKFTRYLPNSSNPKSLPDKNIWNIYKDHDGILWLATNGGLVRCDPKTPDDPFMIYRHSATNPNSLPHIRIWATSDDENSDYLWVGTHDGLAYFNKKTGECERVYRHDISNPRSIGHNQVWGLYKDRHQNIWIGSFGGGVNLINRSKEKFNHYHTIKSDPATIRDNELWSLSENTRGDILAGHRKGLDIIRNGKVLQSIGNTNDRLPVSIDGGRIQAILEDADQNLWLGTDGDGFFKFDTKTKNIKQFKNNPSDKNSLSENYIAFLLQTHANPDVIWIGTNLGLNQFDIKKNTFRHFAHDSANSSSIGHDRVRCMAETSDGQLWVGTYAGLEKFDRSTGQFYRYTHDDKKGSLSENRVWTIYEAKDKSLWVGTHMGLNRFDRNTQKFDVYTMQDGLPNNEIYGLAEDEAGMLWISTAHGISKMDPLRKTFSNYYEKDGLQGDEFNYTAFAKGKSGKIYIGGINGFSAFFPKDIHPSQTIPPVKITSIRKFDRPVLRDRQIGMESSIEFNYDENFFGFDFVGMSYHNILENKYRYKMEGFDRDWVQSGNRRYATYTNLDPGSYQFRVIASNSDGIWNEIGASISVTIKPPWWQTWWFRIFALGTILFLLWTFYHQRIIKLLEIERMRVRIASDLHDDIGSTLTRIAINSETIQSSNDEKTQLTAQKIGNLSREVIRTFSDIVWSIDARNDKVGDLIARIQDTAYQILTPLEIQFSIETTGLVSEKSMAVDARQNIFLICKEAMHNAAKHSKADAVKIQFKNSDQLEVTIHDNGQGLPEEIRQGGNGLKNFHLRAARINGTVKFENDRGLKVVYVGPKI